LAIFFWRRVIADELLMNFKESALCDEIISERALFVFSIFGFLKHFEFNYCLNLVKTLLHRNIQNKNASSKMLSLD
jgi:hypothetical protein